MKKEYIPYYISVLSLTISGVAIGVSFYRTEKLSMDYLGVIVGILALLVTVLLGWNISTALNLKEDWRRLEIKTTREINKLKDGRALLKEYVDANRSYTTGIINFIDGKYGNAIGFLCSAAVKANRINERDIIENSLNNINIALVKHKKDIGDVSYLKSFYKRNKNDFIKIEDKRVETISMLIEEIISSQ